MPSEDEPSLYETPDSPIAAYIDHVPPPEYQSEYISNESINTRSSRSTFDNSQADATHADFRTSKTTGLRISGRPETRGERLARIHREIAEMSAETLDSETDLLLRQIQATSTSPTFSGLTEQTGKVASQISLESIERLSMLESRISSVEGRLNTGSATSLAAQVELLRLKINAITEANVSQDIVQRLKNLNDESAALSEAPLLARINDLYETSTTTSEHLEKIPLLLDRLRSLRSIHENAAESQTRLDTVRADLLCRKKEIAQWQQSLQRLEEQMVNARTTEQDNAEKVKSVVLSSSQ